MGSLSAEKGALTPDGFDLLITRSPRARRITIRVLPGRVRVTVPRRVTDSVAAEFLESRMSWIKGKLALYASHPGPVSGFSVEDGSGIWLFGKMVNFRLTEERAACRLEGGSILVGRGEVSEKKVRKFLDGLLLERVQLTVDVFKGKTGLAPSGIKLRTARSRWGSCSPSGGIMVNRKLVHAPLFVVDYIVTHELVHLIQRNHSPAFWKELRRICPEISEAKKWLRLQGAHLLQ